MHTHADPMSELTIVLVEGLPLKELEEQLFHAFRGGDLFHRMRAFYLVELDERRLYQKVGCANALQYAERKFGVKPRTARELLAVGRELLELPLVDQAFREGAINWSKARLLTRICVPETQSAWLEKAHAMGATEFEREVALSEKGRLPREDGRGLPRVKFKIQARVSAEVHELWETCLQKFADESGQGAKGEDLLRRVCELYLSTSQSQEAGSPERRQTSNESLYHLVVDVRPSGEATLRTEDGPVPLEKSVVERIDCAVHDGPIQGQDPAAKATQGTRTRILRRDGYRCRSCEGRYGLQVHHIEWYSRGGPTIGENLLSLCSACHALVHEGFLEISGKAPGDVVFRDARGQGLDHVDAAGSNRLRMGSLPQGGAAAPRREYVRLEDLPEEMDHETWQRYSHLIRRDPKTGKFRFTPGYVERAEQVEAAGSSQIRMGLLPQHGGSS